MEEFISWSTRLVLGTLVSMAVWSWLRERSTANLHVLLFFLSVSASTLVSLIADLVGTDVSWLQTVGAIGLLGHPYFLLQMAGTLGNVPAKLKHAGLAGWVASVVVIQVLGPDMPLWAVLPVVAYIVVFDVYAALVFFRGAVIATGVTQWRYRFAAAGAAALGVLILSAGLGAIAPRIVETIGSAILLLAPVGLAMFLLAFAPPVWLRRAWQNTAILTFVEELRERRARETTFAWDPLIKACGGLVGAHAVAVAVAEADGYRVTQTSGTASALESIVVPAGEIVAALTGSPAAVALQAGSFPQTAIDAFRDDVGCDRGAIVPLKSSEGRPAAVLLIGVSGHPLFLNDGLELLRVLAEFAAVDFRAWRLQEEREQMTASLADANEDLLKANQELDAFTYSVSHDLKSPLRALKGFSTILAADYKDLLPEDGQQCCTYISTAAQDMGHLIDDLLAFSRLNRQPLNVVEVDLNWMIDGVFKEVQAGEPGRSIEFELDAMPSVEADAGLLRQVFANVLGNAAKYTRQQPAPRITVRLADLPVDDESMTLVIEDNGIGFDMAYVDKIFEPFQRLHRAEDFEGTGVGLALVKRILTKHGGSIWAEGEVGLGSTFYIRLPKSDQSLDEERMAA